MHRACKQRPTQERAPMRPERDFQAASAKGEWIIAIGGRDRNQFVKDIAVEFPRPGMVSACAA
eukprot:15443792-Alexandrium_andersonii.AAC.1